ncbi:hypothetical protein [Chitinimonas sp.]|uniref:hypothetical protein n=1 Tax=Chitinimonas sp. TaxID=1934313 RepID=UPI0035ADB9E0
MRLWAVVMAALIFLTGCFHGSVASSDGAKYIAELGEMIQRSDRIVVNEHSFELDAYDFAAHKSLLSHDVIYDSRELNRQQKALFLATVQQLKPETQDAFPACIFEPHHTVLFFSGVKLISTMKICFQCGQVKWDASTTTPPWALYSGLSGFISGIGLQPVRDWRALARQHLNVGS